MTYHASMTGELPNPSEKQVFQKHVDGESKSTHTHVDLLHIQHEKCKKEKKSQKTLAIIQMKSAFTSRGLWRARLCTIAHFLLVIWSRISWLFQLWCAGRVVALGFI